MAGQNGLCRHIPSNSIQFIVRVGRNDAGMERAQQRGPLFFRFWVSKNDIIKTRHAHMEHTHSSAWCAVLFRWNIYLDRCKCLPATFFTCSPSTCSCSLDFLNDSFVFFSRLLPSEWISIFYPSFRDLLPLNNWLRICFRFLFGTYLQYVHHIYLFLSGNSFFVVVVVGLKAFSPRHAPVMRNIAATKSTMMTNRRNNCRDANLQLCSTELPQSPNENRRNAEHPLFSRQMKTIFFFLFAVRFPSKITARIPRKKVTNQTAIFIFGHLSVLFP